VRTAADPPEAMIARKLDEDVRHLCASPAYLARHGTPRTPADLAQHECLPCRVNGQTMPWRFKSKSGSATRDYLTVDGRLHLNNSLSIRAAALEGCGIAELPRYLVDEDLEKGRLVRVLESFPRVQRALYVLYAPSPFMPTKVRFFVDALKKQAKAAASELPDVDERRVSL